MTKKDVATVKKDRAAAKKLPQPSEPASLAPIAEYHARKSAEEAANYRPTRGKIDDPLRSGASSILRAVEKGGEIQHDTLAELLMLLCTKTDYHFHVEVAILPTGSAIMKTIDNERDAKETIRRLKEKP